MPVSPNKSAKAEKIEKILRRWFVKGMILAFCLWVAFILTGRVLCEIAIEQIAELTNTEITTGSVDFSINGSVFIKNLVIDSGQQKEYDNTILKAKTVYARFGIGSLLLLRPRLEKISVKDFIFDAQHDLDTDQWNIAAFRVKPPKGAAVKMPIIRLKRGTLRYSKVSNEQVRVVAAVPVDAEFIPAPKAPDGCRFNITTAKRADLGESVLTGYWEPGRVTITGGISSADVPAFEKAWMINALQAQLDYDRSGVYSLELKIADLRSRHIPAADVFTAGRDMFSGKTGLFSALQRFFGRYQPSGAVTVDLQAHGSLKRLSESTLIGEVYCKDVSFCYSGFPYTIEHLTGGIDLTEKGAVLNDLRGRHGDTDVVISGWSEGFGPNWKYQIRITSDNMVLDNDLYSALSAKQKKCWSAFSPSGLTAVDYRISRLSGTNRKESLKVKLLGVEAAYCNFPYPLKNLSGRLVFTRDNMIVSDVISQDNDREITLNGKVTAYSTERPVCDVSVKTKNIPLDPTLASILSERVGDFYNRFDMTGLADAEIKIFTPEQNYGPTSFIADVTLRRTSLKSSDFPLAISDVSAKVVITPEWIQIEDFAGYHNQTKVSLTGKIRLGGKSRQPRYRLILNAEQAELNDEFISLLPQQLKRVVSELQPAGKVNLTVDLNRTEGKDHHDYKIIVDCPGNSINFEPFAYPVKNITGRLTITKNIIALENITATATDDSLITSNTSTVKINGRVVLSDDADQPLGSAQDRIELSSGSISFAADNLKISGMSLTMLKADACYDPNRRSWKAENFVADLYGGRLAGKFELKRSADADLEYLLQAGFDNVDLRRFLSDANLSASSYTTGLPKASPERDYDLSGEALAKTNGDYSSGKMSGVLSIAGATGERLPYIGRCRLLITDMQLGRLSPLAKLLYVLKLTEPKDFAFEQMLVDSYIQHSALFIRQLDLSGRAVAFNGSGWIDLQSHNADLVLFARGHRLATAEPSILQSLTESLGQGVVRMEVGGNVYDPTVKATALPVIGEMVRTIAVPRRRK